VFKPFINAIVYHAIFRYKFDVMRIPVKPSGDIDGLAATIPVGMRPPFR